MKRLNKEYKLNVCSRISLKYGSVNKDDPRVVYISGKCWVSPNETLDYEAAIKRLEKHTRKNISSFMADNVNFDGKYILDFDISTDSMTPRKKKFLSFDIYLLQLEANKKPLKELGDVMERKVSTVANNMVYMLNEMSFSVEKTKK